MELVLYKNIPLDSSMETGSHISSRMHTGALHECYDSPRVTHREIAGFLAFRPINYRDKIITKDDELLIMKKAELSCDPGHAEEFVTSISKSVV